MGARVQDQKTKSAGADGWAMGLSGLCLVHCLALPAIAVAAPAALGLDSLHWEFHALFLAVAVTLTAAAFWPSQGHGAGRSRRAMALAVCGLALLGSALLPGLHEHERVVTVAGVLVLAIAHGLNWWVRSRAHARAHLPA
jgi:hypothetical protein